MITLKIITTITLLCGTPSNSNSTYYRYTAEEVLQCQKYYVRCVRDKKKKLSQCIMEKR